MSNLLTPNIYFICSLFGKCRQRAVGLTSLNRRLGMQEWNKLLPIGLNNAAKFTRTGLTSAVRNSAHGGGTEWAEWQNVHKWQWEHNNKRYQVNQGAFFCWCSLPFIALVTYSSQSRRSFEIFDHFFTWMELDVPQCLPIETRPPV